jgi:hypothetical protein
MKRRGRLRGVEYHRRFTWKIESWLDQGCGSCLLIRDVDHFINAVRYIRRNPVKAGLAENHFSLWQSDRASKIS